MISRRGGGYWGVVKLKILIRNHGNRKLKKKLPLRNNIGGGGLPCPQCTQGNTFKSFPTQYKNLTAIRNRRPSLIKILREPSEQKPWRGELNYKKILFCFILGIKNLFFFSFRFLLLVAVCAAAASFSSALDCGDGKIRGVNIGGLFMLEPWSDLISKIFSCISLNYLYQTSTALHVFHICEEKIIILRRFFHNKPTFLV